VRRCGGAPSPRSRNPVPLPLRFPCKLQSYSQSYPLPSLDFLCEVSSAQLRITKTIYGNAKKGKVERILQKQIVPVLQWRAGARTQHSSPHDIEKRRP
jgi:hypothetical protein